MQRQVKSVIGYAEAHKCRSKILLEYFYETQVEKCDVCDVCIEEKRSAEKSSVFERITFEILELLAEKHFTLDELITSLHAGNEKERIEGLRNLLDAGKIKTDGLKYYV
jgi:ATP-dependent DNA helicase RecQ